MNVVNIGNMFSSVFFLLYLQTNFIRNCNGFILDTKLGKFIRNSTNIDQNVPSNKLNKESLTSAFKGFVQIIDDPMLIERSATNYNIPDVVRSEGFVEKVSVTNLKNATLDEVHVANDDAYVELKFTLPSLKIAGWYNMTCHLDRHNVSFYGNGSFVLQLNSLTIRLNVTLEKTTLGRTILNKITWNQTLGDISINIDNLLDDAQVSTIFSENLSVIVPVLHEAYKPSIDEFMSQAVVLYGKMLFLNAKRADFETIIHAFAHQQTL